MPIYRDKSRNRYRFEFDREIEGRRVRSTKLLPKTWDRAKAEAYDTEQTALIYARATGASKYAYTIDDAVAVYLTDKAEEIDHLQNTARELSLMYYAYAGRPLHELPEACKEYRATAKKLPRKIGDESPGPLSAATIRNRLRYLIAACRWGWKHHKMCDSDPAATVAMPKVKNERQRYITRAEMLRIAKQCTNRRTRMAIRIGFYSGMRLGEILKAVPQGDVWALATTKNGEPRHVPIHPKVAVCARRLEPGPKITIQRATARAIKKAGFTNLKFHDLRHSNASAMINEGVHLNTVGAVLGHKDPRSTKRYAHLATASLSEAIQTIGRKVPHTVRSIDN